MGIYSSASLQFLGPLIAADVNKTTNDIKQLNTMEEEDFSKEMIKMEVVEWYSSRNDEALLLYEVYVASGTAYWNDEEELKENPYYPSHFDRESEYLERYFLSERHSIFIFDKEI